MNEFKPTHVFVLLDGERIPVRTELRGDWVAFEANGNRWYTVMGLMDVWWTSINGARHVTRIAKVEKL